MSVEHILDERERTHGSYFDVARVAQELKRVMHAQERWPDLHETQRESLDMIAMKAARILSGAADHPDHWEDIEGYAHLVVRALPTLSAWTAADRAARQLEQSIADEVESVVVELRHV